jgi:hypothetical protein
MRTLEIDRPGSSSGGSCYLHLGRRMPTKGPLQGAMMGPGSDA